MQGKSFKYSDTLVNDEGVVGKQLLVNDARFRKIVDYENLYIKSGFLDRTRRVNLSNNELSQSGI